MKKLIVNADDFGYTEGVTRGILHCFKQGIVSSTTVMANSPILEWSLQEAMKAGIPVGLHANLTKGTPCLPWQEVYSLVDDKGEFLPSPRGLVLSAQSCHVEREIEAQLERVLSLGIQVTHLDGHHHVHGVQLIEEAIIQVANRAGLPVRSISQPQRSRFRTNKIKTPKAFIDDFRGENAKLEYFERVIATLEPGVTEFMCHPGEPADKDLERLSSYNHERYRELEFLTDPRVKAILEDFQVSLVSYRELLE